ncbi:Hypothetical protein D9617_1g086600 [Elsinoe fawcettii]|nr:Hypothetical protein D9617_1g086600 [Elsinoe fawcettii]
MSLLLFSQAILHFNNTPILAMLGILVFLPAATSKVLYTGLSSQRAVLLRPALLILFMSLVLFFEYRLTVNGLVFGILATGILGIIKTITSIVLEHTTEQSGQSSLSTLILCIISSGISAIVFEDTQSALAWFSQAHSPAFLVFLTNFIATTTTFTLGGHVVAYLPSDAASWTGYQRPAIIWPLLCFVGIVLVGTTQAGLTIVDPLQAIFFILAVFSVLDVDYLHLGRQFIASAGQPTRMATALSPLVPFGDHSHPPVYQPVEVDDDEAEDTNPSNGRLSLLQQPTAPSSRSLKALTILTILLWTMSIYRLIIPSAASTRSTPHLDLTYKPESSLDIVISMYSEPLPSLTSTLNLLLSLPSLTLLRPRLFIYTKNYHADLDAISNAVPAPLSPASITLKPNIGRESESYLHHILSHWDTLGNHTLFLQAETHNPRELRPRIRDFFGKDTGFLPLGFAGYSCPCESEICADRFWSDNSGVVRDTFLKASQQSTCPKGKRISLSYKGQFIASAARIRGTEKAVYEELYNAFGDEESWVHKEPYLQGRKEEMSAPVFGFTVERMWNALLQCSEDEVVRGCPMF